MGRTRKDGTNVDVVTKVGRGSSLRREEGLVGVRRARRGALAGESAGGGATVDGGSGWGGSGRLVGCYWVCERDGDGGDRGR